MMSLMMRKAPVTEVVSTALACQMDGIDWITTHGEKASYLRKLCADNGLYIAAHTMIKWGFVKRMANYFDEFKASLDDTCELGAPILMLPPFPRENQVSLEDDRKCYTEYYAKAYELASKAGVTLTLESTGFHNSPITTADECLEVLRQVPGLKVTFDQGNVATADDPCETFLKLRDYVVHFHVKDWNISEQPGEGRTLKRDGRYYADATIGEGEMDIRKFWQLTNERERQLYVNPETQDYTGTRTSIEVFRQVCGEMRSWEK